MTVKELRKILKDLPENMEIMIDSGVVVEPVESKYGSIAKPIKKAKTKLHKRIFGLQTIQKRPHKDEIATLSLIIE